MGLFQDQTSSLSEIKRLAALVTDPSRREEIGSDQWPLAMIAYGLVTCNETGREEEGVTIYNMFQSRCPPQMCSATGSFYPAAQRGRMEGPAAFCHGG